MVSARLLMGAGSAVGGSAATAYAMDVLSLYPKHKGRLLGALNAAGALAWILGPALGGFLAERAGIGLPFVLVGGILLATAPAIHWLLPETQPPAPGTSVASLRFRALLDGTQRSFGALARDRNQQALMLMQCALFTGWSCSLTVLPLYAAATHGASPAELGTLYSVSSALGVLGAPLGGAAADPLPRRRSTAGQCTQALCVFSGKAKASPQTEYSQRGSSGDPHSRPRERRAPAARCLSLHWFSPSMRALV